MFSSSCKDSPARLAAHFFSVIGVFAPVFSRPVWPHGKILLTGTIHAPGRRTVTEILQIVGRSAASDFSIYRRGLHRAVWSPRKASRLLLRLLVARFIPQRVVVLGLDDTIERRRGDAMTAQGVYYRLKQVVPSPDAYGLAIMVDRITCCSQSPDMRGEEGTWDQHE